MLLKISSFLPQMGIEPIPYCYDGILSPARLPIPPLRLNDPDETRTHDLRRDRAAL